MDSLHSVASATASTVNASWKRDNRFARFTVGELNGSKFSIHATGVTATQAAEPPGLPPGVVLVGQRARVSDTPGSTGFVWEAEYKWHQPFTQWLSEIIASAFVRVAVLLAWMVATLAVIGAIFFVGYLVVGFLRAKLSAPAHDSATPLSSSPVACPTPAPTRARYKPPDVISADVPIEECRGDTCHISNRRN
jgi:hypothetical protein